MAAFTIMSSADGKTVTLSAMGHFDMSLGFALWQYCEPDRNRHESAIPRRRCSDGCGRRRWYRARRSAR
ncbi:MAG: hypothetical protein ACREXX_17225 [Gammaproteobacteria bacterium]